MTGLINSISRYSSTLCRFSGHILHPGIYLSMNPSQGALSRLRLARLGSSMQKKCWAGNTPEREPKPRRAKPSQVCSARFVNAKMYRQAWTQVPYASLKLTLIRMCSASQLMALTSDPTDSQFCWLYTFLSLTFVGFHCSKNDDRTLDPTNALRKGNLIIFLNFGFDKKIFRK